MHMGFFQAQLDIVYFIYGGAFFFTGLSILVQSHTSSETELSRHIPWLGLFGVLHGFNEWLDMWEIIKEFPTGGELFKTVFLLVSYIPLFEFGRLTLKKHFRYTKPDSRISFLFSLWIYPFLGAAIILGSLANADHLLGMANYTRYTFGLLGALFTGLGFLWSRSVYREIIRRCGSNAPFFTTSIAFLVYAFLGGLVGHQSSLFPASLINYESFQSTFAMPVQLLRAACAVAALVGISFILRMFRVETYTKLKSEEEHVKQLNADLERRVRDRTSQLEAAKEKLEAEVAERKQMEEKLRDLSLYDSLTQVYNRTFFEEEMQRLAENRFLPLSIIICDINGLKLMNDAMGHSTGDELLRVTARILKQSFRSSDIIARIGGDEFAILLPRYDEEHVEACSNRIRRELEDYNLEETTLRLSLSIGYAIAKSPPVDPRDLFKRADDAMFKEKLQQRYSYRSETVQALIKTLEARDHITDGHAERLKDYALRLGKLLGLSEERLNDLMLLARFHDLGKVGVPDRVLFKPGPLTEEEFEEMKSHCEIGHRIALSLADLAPIADFILKHHERWDGRGYPLGLQKKTIPLEDRILTIVDAYDAITNERPYKPAYSHSEAVRELRRCAGTQFDPALVEQFIRLLGDPQKEGEAVTENAEIR